METLYGKYPKKIICKCNAGERDGESDILELNDRCQKCNSLRRICIPKAEARVQAVSGMPAARQAEEHVLAV